MNAEDVMIHVRFSPDGSVTEIGERPDGVAPQQWFDRLASVAGESFRPLSGGRGVFQLGRGELDRAKSPPGA